VLLRAFHAAFSAESRRQAIYAGVEPDNDMFIRHWKESMPQKTHGSLVERDILTRAMR
jgi:hypothetical protein